ncbi:MAG: YbhN family protein [Hormoscilla sp.]
MNAPLKLTVKRLKPYLRWVILGGTIFFLAKALKDNWQEVLTIALGRWGWFWEAIALSVTLLAHIWSGWIWGLILREFDQPVGNLWSIRVYLITNIAKYLPGNLWHFYGRIRAAIGVGVPVTVATLSTLMEPLLMAAAALIVASIASPQTQGILPLPIITMVTIGVHPRVLNPVLKQLASWKDKGKPQVKAASVSKRIQLQRYPWRPLLGEMGFLGLRGMGFLFAMYGLHPIAPGQIPLLMSAFSLAWLLGLVLPGAPGGIGIFEATAIALLEGEFSPAIILSGVALYRVISILAEIGGALLAWWHKPGSAGDPLGNSK